MDFILVLVSGKVSDGVYPDDNPLSLVTLRIKPSSSPCIIANLGVPERSQSGARRPMSFGGAPPRDRAMGTGSAGCETRETRDHDYADAQRRGSHPVTLSAG